MVGKGARRKLGKLPKKIGSLLDRLNVLQEEKKEAEALLTEIKADIQMVKDAIFLQFKTDDIKGARGSSCQASISKKIIPVANNWDKIYTYVKKGRGFDRFDLLQKRLATRAIRERWDHDIVIPGVGEFEKIDLSVTTLK